jgi:hypothetical protein
MSSPAHAARPVRSKTVAALRLGVVLSAAGAAALAGAGSAQASLVDTSDPLGTVGHAVTPLTDLQLHPLANTGVDPVDNSVGTQVADFQPVSTEAVTGPLARGSSLSDLLPATGLLPG